MAWDIQYYDEKLQAAVLALPPGLLARYIHLTDRMVEYGPDLGMPHTRAMGAGLFELRLKSGEGIGRVFYCTLVARRTRTPAFGARTPSCVQQQYGPNDCRKRNNR